MLFGFSLPVDDPRPHHQGRGVSRCWRQIRINFIIEDYRVRRNVFTTWVMCRDVPYVSL